MRLLEPCQLEDYPITTLFENNRFSSFFCKRNKEIQGSTMHVVMQVLKLFNKPFERT